MPNEMQGSWKNRRRVIFSTLAFCAAMLTYIVVWGSDSELNEAVATSLIILAGSVIGSYVFGAIWDDSNHR